MQDRVLQCCYSNIRLETGAAGWRATAASAELSPNVLEKYKKLQDVNVVTVQPVDKNGKPLNMYELVVQEDYVYVTRVAYGLEDTSGRKNNMLSHTYLFPVTQELLADPNGFLTVSDDNFTSDIEEARNIRTSFDRFAPFTLESAMEACGLDEEKYLNLIYSIYAKKEEKKESLYIRTCRGEAVIRPLLYCLFAALPFSMRREISCASAVVNKGSVKALIVSENTEGADFWFDLDTGANNILTDRNVKKYSRWGFIDYFVKNRSRVDGTAYFDKLEKLAIRLGDQKASKLKVLRLAYQIMETEDTAALDFEESRSRIYDALTAPVDGSDELDAYLSMLLKKINETGRVLDETVDEVLMEKLQQTSEGELARQGEQYLINKITHMDAKDGAAVLMELSDEKFEQFSRVLVQRDNGNDYLDYYFFLKFPARVTWETLTAYADRVSDHCGDHVPMTAEKMEKSSRALYEQELQGDMSVTGTYTQYVEICKYIDTFMHKYEEAEIERNAKEIFWKQYSLESFDHHDMSFVPVLSLAGNRKCESLRMLELVFARIRQDNMADAASYLYELADNYGRQFSRQERDVLYDNLKDCMAEYCMGNVESYKRRFYLACKLGTASFRDEMKTYCRLIGDWAYDEFIQQYEHSIELLRREDDRKLIRAYNDILISELGKRGLWAECSVDVLLAIGRSKYENPFEMLDTITEAQPDLYGLIMTDPEELVRRSTLLFTDVYAEYGDAYLRSDVGSKGLVKEWMAVAKRQTKAARKNEKKNEAKPSLGGFMGKMLRREEKSADAAEYAAQQEDIVNLDIQPGNDSWGSIRSGNDSWNCGQSEDSSWGSPQSGNDSRASGSRSDNDSWSSGVQPGEDSRYGGTGNTGQNQQEDWFDRKPQNEKEAKGLKKLGSFLGRR